MENEPLDDKKRNMMQIVIIVFVMIILGIGGYLLKEKVFSDKKTPINEKPENQKPIKTPPIDNLSGNYNIDIIKTFNTYANKSNYLLSPYNIEIALNMLRDGADGSTKDELDKVLGNRTINDVSDGNKISIANAVFIKDTYKNNVKLDYYNTLNNKYQSDIIYDEFTKPDKINSWVNQKTNGMINSILDQMSNDFVMGLASALAIDVKWTKSFNCDSTTSQEFTKIDNQKINVEMMHETYESSNYRYFETNDAKGIILPYEKETNAKVELEFVGILPNDNVDNYVNSLTKDKLDNLINSQKSAGDDLHINLSLPRFKYEYDAKKFIDILKSMGITHIFEPDNANFSKMIEIKDYNVYVNEAIHKTYIDLSEAGTKAAAVTYFGMYKNSAMNPTKVENVNINFNKPFAYMIREKNTGEVLFFGVVYEPNLWNGSTCINGQ